MKLVKLLIIFNIIAIFYGCAAERSRNEGLDLIANDHLEEGVAKLEQAVKQDPANFQYRTELINKRSEAINKLLLLANAQRSANQLDEAEATYRRVLAIEPNNARALNEIKSIASYRNHAELIKQAEAVFKAGNPAKALEILKPVIIENPKNPAMLTLKRSIEEQQTKASFNATPLNAIYTKPITLEFRDANLKMVFEVLSRTTGINFVLDKDVRSDQRATLFLKQSSIEDAIDLLLATNQLEKKVLNENSILIYPNTKAKEYQDLVVRSFYLSNADVKQTMNMLKTLIKAKDMFIDEKLNLIVMRDTPEAVQLAERLIKVHDLAEPEVMLEVEVLEVKRSRLLDLGIKFPDQLTLTPLPSNGSTVTLRDLKNLGSGGIGANVSDMVINAKKQDTDINLLANPRIRARNREKAKIMIGDKVPVITTTSTATGFVAENVQYLDVGLKLEVEPNVHIPDDVAIKVTLEVSSITNQIRSSAGTLAYQIGTRNASTVLRLKDGETQVLAGLISDEDRRTADKVPGLGELPLVGRLFSSHRDDNQKTEIVLSITPHLIRGLQRPEASGEEFWSGTETTLRTKPLSLAPIKTALNESKVEKKDGANPVSAIPVVEKVGINWQGPKEVKTGEQFSITLKLKSESELRSAPFQISYDPAVLEFVDVTEGDFFKRNNGKTNFTNQVDSNAGRLFIGIGRNKDGIKGEGAAVVITFKAIAAKPETEVKLMTAAPISVMSKIPEVVLPAAYLISIK